MPSDERVRGLVGRLGAAGDVRVWRAPGRVNIIGEHVDYAGGLVLPFACDLDVLLASVPESGRVVLESADAPGVVDLDLDGGLEADGWGRYPSGVVRALRDGGLEVHGVRGVLASRIPVGAGLASSAALEAVAALALTGGVRPAPEVLQRAEHLATGVPCGVMDQTAVLEGRRGEAVLLDCGTGRREYVALPPDLAFVVVDTGTRRELADGRYAQRRAEVEEGLEPRLRHVRTENERVHAMVDALRTGDLETVGALLDASHASLRGDFEVSGEALDHAVEVCREHPGVLGARLVGAGFAGCVLAAVGAAARTEAATWISSRLRERLPGAEAFPVEAVDAAGELPL